MQTAIETELLSYQIVEGKISAVVNKISGRRDPLWEAPAVGRPVAEIEAALTDVGCSFERV